VREGYEQWIQQRIAEGAKSSRTTLELSEAARPSPNALFDHLMVVIEQELVHSFLHWHSDQKELADATWEVGGAAMMQATKITKPLAAKHAAPAPAAAVMSGTVMLPSVGGTSEEA